jgi:hypothetical protein
MEYTHFHWLNKTRSSNNYSPNSDCKWLINAPEGKVIHIKFAEFDTEAKTDLLYFFNGSRTHEKDPQIPGGNASVLTPHPRRYCKVGRVC